MAFTQSTFAPVGANSAPSPAVYSYSTDDTAFDLVSSGYFAEKSNQLNQGDYILAVASTGSELLVVTTPTDTAILADDGLLNRVIVRSASDLTGDLSSTVDYFLDGTIDMGDASIVVPVGGLHISGYDFNTSKLISTSDNYHMFTSPIGGSGTLIGLNFAIEVSGTNSQVYNIVDATGNNAVELSRVNYDNCTSLGVIDGYRQGLETGTGRFGGSPTLTLSGTWTGGFRITTSITRALDSGMTGSLFEAGAGFTMASRFLTDMNVDLPASASILDFATGNFTEPSLLQLTGMIVTRNGVSNAGDSNLTPNIDQTDIASSWEGNQGLNNTFEGGKLEITTEAATTIAVSGTFYPLAGTWTASELQHFTESSNGHLMHMGDNPREFTLISDLVIVGTANNVLRIRIMTHDDSTGTDTEVGSQVRTTNNIVGPRDVAFFTITSNFILDQNDYVYLEVVNDTSTDNVTAELSSFFQLTRR